MKIRSLMVSVHYPNKYLLWTPWNKYANLAISRLKNIEVEVIAPLPFSPSIKYLPYYEFGKIPLIEYSEEGKVHHPRFLYLLPKKIFYGFIGEFYRRSVSNYILKNIEKSDLIHAHQIYPDAYGVMNLCKEWNIPLIVDVHSRGSLDTWLNHRRIRDKVIKVLEFSSKILCVSDELSKFLNEIGFDSDKIEVLPLGVDIRNFNPNKKNDIRENLSIKEEKLILFVGRLDKLKGVDCLLMAIDIIRRSFKVFKLVIVGNGPELQNLKNLTEKLNLTDFTLFTGELKGNNLINWFIVADLFILPSFTEGRPMVIYEAMASGCPIIASNVGGIPEQVKDGYNGYLIKPGHKQMLADKIEFLLKNDDLIQKMGINSRKRVIEEKWTWEEYANRINNLYNKLVE